MHMSFANKGIDAINISNILHNKKVTSTRPPYLKNQSVPVLSYTYTNTIASKIFNYKKALQHIDIDNYHHSDTPCKCSPSSFNYVPIGHIITGDLSIVQHAGLRKIMACGPKFREPRKINWSYNFKIIMDSIEEYANQWAKREKVEPDTISEWVKAVRGIVCCRIHKLQSCYQSRPKSIFSDLKTRKCLTSLHHKYVIVPADKAANNIVFVCRRYCYECLIKELGFSDTYGNSAYKRSTFSKEEILANPQVIYYNIRYSDSGE